MNEADSGRVAAELDALGYAPIDNAQDADVIVLNTCVVRQSAEDRAVGHLWSLKPLKELDPNRVIALMGCMVGIKPNAALRQRFPFVDVFMPPSEPGPLVGHLTGHEVEAEAKGLDDEETEARHLFLDYGSPEAAAMGLVDEWEIGREGEWEKLRPSPPIPPVTQSPNHPLQSVRHLSLSGATPVAAHVPIVYGCSHACTFCIIPFRRGVERSRPLDEIVAEVEGLVAQGVREVTLLGQIVDRYGKDFEGQKPDLADLFRAVHEVDGLWRIRFLTSHPSYMTDRILRAVAELPKVCEQIEVPVQSGDDDVLADDEARLHARRVSPAGRSYPRSDPQHGGPHRHHRRLPRRDGRAVPAHLRLAGRAEGGQSAPGDVLAAAGHRQREAHGRRRAAGGKEAPLGRARCATGAGRRRDQSAVAR